jgi:hypothetical protein
MIHSFLTRLAFTVLSLFWGAAGWFVLLQGGFHKTYKFTRETTFVGGANGVVMAYLFLLLATVAAFVVLQSICARRFVFVLLALMVLAPPIIFLLRT